LPGRLHHFERFAGYNGRVGTPVEQVVLNQVFLGNVVRIPRRAGMFAARVAAGLAIAIAPQIAQPASVSFGQDVVTAAVARRIFVDDGRKMLAGTVGSCTYAYAEQPAVTFRGGRVYLRMHFSGRAGLNVNGACMGPAESFHATLSGQPHAEGETIGLRDVRMDEGKKEYRNLLEPLLRRQIPALLGSNLRSELSRYLDSNIADFRMLVKDFQLQDVTANDGVLQVRFDFSLQAARR